MSTRHLDGSPDPDGRSAAALAEVVRVERARVIATLRRLTGDLDAAEDAFADAAVEALETWPRQGTPSRPGAWLTTVARRRALDRLRREQRRPDKEVAAVRFDPPPDGPDEDPLAWSTIRDDQLGLIFTCCHPALAPEARVALTLRTLCGLTTTEIARAFWVAEPTMGQRIARAKRKIRDARIPFRVPADHELPARVAAVLAVVNVVFTAGHHAAVGEELVRVDLAEEAIRLARVLLDLMPDEPEVAGLLCLLEATWARRGTRVDASGDPVLLADADRSLWDRELAEAASSRLEAALRLGRPGPFQVQAAISCLHSLARSIEETDWRQIVVLYDHLVAMSPTPATQVNRAVAVAEVGGPAAGLAALDAVVGGEDWHLRHAARADLLRRLGDREAATAAYRAALDADPGPVDARFLRRRLADLRD